jgi:hypothetical protein
MQSPPSIATKSFTDAVLAVARLEEIYERNTKFLRDRFEAYVNGEAITTRVRAYYPFVRVTTATYARLDSRLAYGFVAGPGVHETSVTRPDLFRAYLTEQIGLLIQNHGVPVEIGESAESIPIHFAYRRDINIEAAITTSENSLVTRSLRDAFDVPDLATMDDSIADGTFELQPGAPEPLSLFRAARVDYSLRRLYHYTGTDPEHFQNFVIFRTTNSQYCPVNLRGLGQKANSGGAFRVTWGVSDLNREWSFALAFRVFATPESPCISARPCSRRPWTFCRGRPFTASSIDTAATTGRVASVAPSSFASWPSRS